MPMIAFFITENRNYENYAFKKKYSQELYLCFRLLVSAYVYIHAGVWCMHAWLYMNIRCVFECAHIYLYVYVHAHTWMVVCMWTGKMSCYNSLSFCYIPTMLNITCTWNVDWPEAWHDWKEQKDDPTDEHQQKTAIR